VDEEVVNRLFPDITKAERREQNYEKKIDWISTNTELNPEQEIAVRRVLANSSKPFPYIILGPPGTGKTATLTETILQLLQTQSDCRVVVTAPSNAAVDNLALKLLDFVKPNEITRIYSQTRFDQKIGTRLARVAF
jgi:superfamily II DNA or RNA helicase